MADVTGHDFVLLSAAPTEAKIMAKMAADEHKSRASISIARGSRSSPRPDQDVD